MVNYMLYRYCAERNIVQLSHDSNIYINLLEEYWNISNYRATLGHVVNHSFTNPNAYFGKCIHPRHGPIAAIISSRAIKKGEEILCYYGLEANKLGVPHWYAAAYRKEVREQWPGEKVYDDTSKTIQGMTYI